MDFNQIIEEFETHLKDIEKEFDEIAEGKIIWNNMVASFYKPFHHGVAHTMETAERAVGERMLGVTEEGKPRGGAMKNDAKEAGQVRRSSVLFTYQELEP